MKKENEFEWLDKQKKFGYFRIWLQLVKIILFPIVGVVVWLYISEGLVVVTIIFVLTVLTITNDRLLSESSIRARNKDLKN